MGAERTCSTCLASTEGVFTTEQRPLLGGEHGTGQTFKTYSGYSNRTQGSWPEANLWCVPAGMWIGLQGSLAGVLAA